MARFPKRLTVMKTSLKKPTPERGGGPMAVAAARHVGMAAVWAPHPRRDRAACRPARLAPRAALWAAAGPALARPGPRVSASGPAGGRAVVGAVGGRRDGPGADPASPAPGGQGGGLGRAA